MKASEILTKAKALLFTRGWKKGLSRDNKVCAVMAIDCTHIESELAEKYLARVIDPKSKYGATTIIAFNDHPDTTFEMVLAKFDLAYELAVKENN